MEDNIIDLSKKKELLQMIFEITGNSVAAFYELQSYIPALQGVTWEQVQAYGCTLNEEEKTKKR